MILLPLLVLDYGHFSLSAQLSFRPTLFQIALSLSLSSIIIIKAIHGKTGRWDCEWPMPRQCCHLE